MPEPFNPWKMVAIGMALVCLILMALVTGLVVANWHSDAPEGALKSGDDRSNYQAVAKDGTREPATREKSGRPGRRY